MIDHLLLGFQIALTFTNLFYCLVGVTLGMVVGILPGIGPAATVALLLPITFRLNVTSAIIMLSGVYYGVAYGGTITSVLLSIPGEACTVVTCLDGYQMARKGRAGPALGIAAFGSFFGGTFGIIAMTFMAIPLSKIALTLGPAEYTSLMIAGLTLVTYLSSKSTVKSLTMAVLGLICGCVGLDPITAQDRMTFGSLYLLDGFSLAALGMGLFGISEVLIMAEETVKQGSLTQASLKIRNLLPTKQDWKDSAGPIARATPLGFFLGILPGGGAVMSSFLSYALEKRVSKHPEKFGTGTIEGVAGPETANNSGTQGAFIPLLLLGLPFNVVTALILAAFVVHGVAPGPLILKSHPDVFWGVVCSMYIGNVMLLIMNIPLISIFVQILRIRYAILTPLIALVCFVGAFSINFIAMEVVIMVLFGFVGYLARKFEYDPAPMVIAFVLGPLLEKSFRQTLIISNGSYMVFLERPIAATILAIAFLTLTTPLFRLGYRYIHRCLL